MIRKCSFCTQIVDFIIKKDKRKLLHAIPVQSKDARALLKLHNEVFISLQTIYFIDGTHVLKKSSAIFKILSYLPPPVKYFHLFTFLPRQLTDLFYNMIAK